MSLCEALETTNQTHPVATVITRSKTALRRCVLMRFCSARGLYSDHPDQLLHRSRAFIQPGLLFQRQFDLDDLLNSLRTQLYRYTNIQPVDAVFPLQIGGAGENLLLVLQNRLNHLGCCGGWSVIGRPGLQIFHDLGATVTRTLYECVQAALLNQFCNRNAGNSGITGQRDHRVAMTAQYECRHVLDADLQFVSNECTETGRIEYSRHADYAFPRKSTELISSLRHRIERVRDHNQDAIR